MGASVSPPPALSRLITTAIVGLATVAVGLTMMTVKNTPTGASASKNIQCFSNTGSTVVCVRENGNVSMSGSLIVQGVLIGTGSDITNPYNQNIVITNSKGVQAAGILSGVTLKISGVMSGANLVVGGGQPFKHVYNGSATLDFANLAVASCEVLTITVNGAVAGDTVDLGVPDASNVANGSFTAWVSSANTVSVKFCAVVSGDPASGTFRATVLDF